MFETIRSIVGDVASGAIKDEQLKLLDMKLASTLEEAAALKQRVAQLEARNAELEAQIALHHEISNQSSRLSSPQEEVLKIFFDRNGPLTAAKIAHALSIHPSEAMAHIDSLRELNYVRLNTPGMRSNFGKQDATFVIDREGRAYVMAHLRR